MYLKYLADKKLRVNLCQNVMKLPPGPGVDPLPISD
jgi:hypothetical protein